MRRYVHLMSKQTPPDLGVDIPVKAALGIIAWTIHVMRDDAIDADLG